jgi:Tol biopolymer transport system component
MFEKFYSMVEDTLVWSPDGQYLLFDWSDFGLTMTRIPVFHLADLTLGKISLIASNQIWVVPSWAPEGKYIVTSQVTTIVDSQGSQQSVINLFTINALTSINERLTITSSADLYPSYSPNGRWIAFVRYSSDALTPKPGSGANCPFTPNNYGGCNIADLYIIDRNDGKPLLLLKSIYVQIDQYLRDSSYNAPSWSPDSQWLAVLTGNEQPDITLVNIKSVETRVLAPHSGLDIYPTWSPDGNKLAFVSNREGNEEIYLISPDGTGLVNLTNNVGNDFNPVWSPSGRYIAFLSNREGGTHLYVMKADGTDQRKLRDGYVITRPAWFPLVGVDLKEYFDLENK